MGTTKKKNIKIKKADEAKSPGLAPTNIDRMWQLW